MSKIIDLPKKSKTKRGTGEWARKIGKAKSGKSQDSQANAKRKEAADLRTLKVGLYELLKEAFIDQKNPKMPNTNDVIKLEAHMGSLIYDYLVRKLDEDQKN